ncbi:MAG: Gfo/Idh/MocA family oxidoreductase [Betaproteobacteria bacterium]|nr:Gfo/Idh/MocA family oxidoreductase [Betaproteobacteria bacterium]
MTSSNRLRVGFIGANGRWGPSAHAPALQRLPQTEIYAVCTADEDTARAAAEKYGVERAYSDDKAMDALCMVAGELTEAAAVVSTQVPQWYETDTKKHVDVTAPDNIVLAGRLEGGAVVNANLGVHPYHGTGYRLEIYGTEGTLAMVGGGDAGAEVKRKIMGGRKNDKTLQEPPVPDRLKWVPEDVRGLGPGYDVGQMWVKFAEAIRTGTRIEPDFDSAVRRHRMLDAIVRASQTGQRQKIAL